VIKYKTITTDVEVVDEYLCNKCGCSQIKKFSEDDARGDVYGLPEVVVTGGYLSRALADCTEYRFSLCEECLAEMFKTFKIPAGERDYM
jgi:uncharacterized cysteine cluster protein YcgN (CxxCxxCC family)